MAGNVSEASLPLELEIDSSPPLPPEIVGINEDSGLPGDGVTNDVSLQLVGIAEPGAIIEFEIADQPISGTTQTNDDGSWEFDLTGIIDSDGTFEIRASAIDIAGNRSEISQPFRVTVDTISPSAPSLVSIEQDTGGESSDGITRDNTLKFAGFAEPGSRVGVSETSLGEIGIANANDLGGWEFDFSGTVLSDGSYEFSAVSLDLAGNVSEVSNVLTVTIDTVSPTLPTLDRIVADTGAAADDGVTSDNTLVFEGTGEAGASVTLNEVTLGELGTSLVNADGRWSFDYQSVTLADGSYEVTTTSTDLAGNESVGSAVFQFTVDTGAPGTPSIIRIDEDRGVSDSGPNNQRHAAGIFWLGPCWCDR